MSLITTKRHELGVGEIGCGDYVEKPHDQGVVRLRFGTHRFPVRARFLFEEDWGYGEPPDMNLDFSEDWGSWYGEPSMETQVFAEPWTEWYNEPIMETQVFTEAWSS